VIFNPAARGEKAQRFRRHLQEIGAVSTLKRTTAAGHARGLATEAVAEGFETIVAAGGDGTVNEVLNGLGDAPGGFDRARLAVLPLGTVNVFARELAIPLRPDRAWAAVLRGRETTVDLPTVEFSTPAGNEHRWFAQLAGAGLDARAVELVHWPLKKRIGPLAYVWAGLKALAGPPCQIAASGSGQAVEGQMVLIGNGRLYGGNYRVFPGADLRDGLLEVCVFPRVNWFTLARCGPQLLLRGTLPRGVTRCFQTTSLSLLSAARTPLELDGEFVGQLPAHFSIKPSTLRVVVPD
jgi:YegS/Rv2252/BmrU family lipid kinase